MEKEIKYIENIIQVDERTNQEYSEFIIVYSDNSSCLFSNKFGEIESWNYNILENNNFLDDSRIEDEKEERISDFENLYCKWRNR